MMIYIWLMIIYIIILYHYMMIYIYVIMWWYILYIYKIIYEHIYMFKYIWLYIYDYKNIIICIIIYMINYIYMIIYIWLYNMIIYTIIYMFIYIYDYIYIYNIVKDMLTHVYCIQLCQPTNAEDLFSQDLIPVPWWRQWTETPGAVEKARQVAASDVDERRWRPVASVSNHALHGSQSLAQCLVGIVVISWNL